MEWKKEVCMNYNEEKIWYYKYFDDVDNNDVYNCKYLFIYPYLYPYLNIPGGQEHVPQQQQQQQQPRIVIKPSDYLWNEEFQLLIGYPTFSGEPTTAKAKEVDTLAKVYLLNIYIFLYPFPISKQILFPSEMRRIV